MDNWKNDSCLKNNDWPVGLIFKSRCYLFIILILKMPFHNKYEIGVESYDLSDGTIQHKKLLPIMNLFKKEIKTDKILYFKNIRAVNFGTIMVVGQ